MMKPWIVVVIIIFCFISFLAFGIFEIKQTIDKTQYVAPISPPTHEAVVATKNIELPKIPNLPEKPPSPKPVIVAHTVSLDKTGIGNWLYDGGVVRTPKNNQIIVCSGYGCIFKRKYRFDQATLDIIKKIMDDVSGPASERLLLPKALEAIRSEVSRKLGMHDAPGSPILGNGDKSQMSDSDEIIDTVQYLWIMAENGLLKYHDVMSPTHGWIYGSSNRIRDITTKDIYAITFSSSGDIVVSRSK